LAGSRRPVLLTGEAGSGRRHTARCLHALSMEAGSFAVWPENGLSLEAALESDRGTVYLPSIEDLPWTSQEALAAAINSKTVRPRIVASTSIDPLLAAEE